MLMRALHGAQILRCTTSAEWKPNEMEALDISQVQTVWRKFTTGSSVHS
jgi:hypothetical protein